MKNSFYNNLTLTFRDKDFETGFRVYLKKNEIRMIEKVVFLIFTFNAIYLVKDYFYHTIRDEQSMLFQAIVVLPVYIGIYVTVRYYKARIKVGSFYYITSFTCVFTILSQLQMVVLNGTQGGPLFNIVIIAIFASYIFSGIIFSHVLVITPFLIACLSYIIVFKFDFDIHQIINLLLMYSMTFLTIIWYKFNNESLMRNSFNKSELLQLEDTQLKESYLEINAMSELRKDLISILAHDVRSPLASLHSVISMTKDEDLTMEESKMMMNELEGQVNKVEFLINDILVWIKSQSEEAHLEMGTINLMSITEDLKFIFSDIFEEKGLTFQLDFEEGRVFGQEDMIKTILRNLISNAIKFSKEGDKIILSSRLEEGLVKVSVVDSGVGMTEKILKKIKKTFASTLGTNKEKGVGLGLKICQALVRAHKSTLEFESTEGKGTTVSFLLGQG